MTTGPVDARQFRQALGAFTTGVTIVTTRDREGRDVGLTVNSFNSVSLDPPLVLWSLARNAASLEAFSSADHFAVHILAADQEALSNRFAQRGVDKFAGQQVVRGRGDIPLLEGCAARFQCRSAFRYDGGDHEIFVGEVVSFENFNHPPLVFQRGKYALALKKAERPLREGVPGSDLEVELDRNALSVLLGMAYYQLSTHLGPALAKHGIREDDYWAVSVVGGEEGRTIARIDELIAFTGRHVTPAQVDGLRARGFVRVAGTGPEAQVFLTEKGRRLMIEMAAIAMAVEESAEASLDYSEVQLLKQLLQRVIRSHQKTNPA